MEWALLAPGTTDDVLVGRLELVDPNLLLAVVGAVGAGAVRRTPGGAEAARAAGDAGILGSDSAEGRTSSTRCKASKRCLAVSSDIGFWFCAIVRNVELNPRRSLTLTSGTVYRASERERHMYVNYIYSFGSALGVQENLVLLSSFVGCESFCLHSIVGLSAERPQRCQMLSPFEFVRSLWTFLSSPHLWSNHGTPSVFSNA